MTCERVRPELTGFHFGAVEGDDRREVEAHLVACRACLEEYFELKRAVEGADLEDGPSPASRARLRRAVADTLRRERAWAWWERPLAVGLAAASVALALGAVHAVATTSGAAPHAVERGVDPVAPPQ